MVARQRERSFHFPPANHDEARTHSVAKTILLGRMILDESFKWLAFYVPRYLILPRCEEEETVEERNFTPGNQ